MIRSRCVACNRLGLLTLVVTCTTAACAGSPARSGGRAGTRLDRLGGHALVGMERRRLREEGAVVEDKLVLREEAGIHADGTVYDPRFLRYSAGGTFRVNQADSRLDDRGLDTTVLPLYSAVLAFLEEHPFPVTLRARRDEDRALARSFGASPFLRTRTEEAGATLGVRLPPLDGRLDYGHTDVLITGDPPERNTVRDYVEANFRHNPGEPFRSEFRFLSEWVREEPSGQDHGMRWLTFRNTADFGQVEKRPEVSFQTSLDAWQRSGTYSQSNLQFSEEVAWWLREDLESRTRYEFWLFGDGRETRHHAVRQSFLHRLYESLETTVGVHGSTDDVGDGQTDRYGGSMRLDYRKRTDLGLLRLGYGFGKERQQNDLQGDYRPVLGEAHVLSSASFTVLDNTDVDIASVVVSSSDRVLIHVEGLDYALIPRGNLVELVRLLGGTIPDGALVLVDYRYREPSSVTFDKTAHRFQVSFVLFGLLDLYAALDRVRQDVVRGEGGDQLEDLDSRLLGTSLGWRGWHVRAEYTDHDSSQAPYVQRSGELGYTATLGDRTQVGLSVAHYRVSFPQSEETRTTLFQGRVRARLGHRLTLLFEPGYRIERGRGLEHDVLDLLLDLQYSYGELEFHLLVEHEARSPNAGGPGDRQQTYVELSARREW